MYNINVPPTMNQITGVFYGLGVWNHDDGASLFARSIKLFHFIYFSLFVTSVVGGAVISNDPHEFVFLVDLSILVAVHGVRMFYIMSEKDAILSFIHQIGTHSTNEVREFDDLNNKLKKFDNFAKFFVSICIVEVLFALIFPVVSKQSILLNIAFPWKKSETTFWITHSYIALGCAYSILWFLLTIIIWYLMINCSTKYQLLGTRLRNLGGIRTENPKHQDVKLSKSFQEKMFLRKLIETIESHQNINEQIDHFSATFSNFFLIQIVTSSISICGSVYILAFNSHENLVQDGIYCVFLFYNLFDILAVMYMGNEIKLSSERLSYCLFESNWMEQSVSCKKCIITMIEYMKKPQELIVGKLYQLNLQTFTSILNGAYSLFNILRKSNLRN